MSRPLALVTGASSGFGAGFARRFAAEGYDLVLVARREDRLRALADELAALGAAAHVLPTDLSTADGVAGLVSRLEADGLALDALVNNAGFGTYGTFAEQDPVRIAEEIAVNVTALTLLTRALLPQLLAAPAGILINISSTASYQPGPNISVYAATKAYVRSLTEAIWQEAKGTSLRVLNIAPGPSQTEFFAVAGTDAFKVGQQITTDDVVGLAFSELAKGAKRPSRIVGRGNALQAMAARFAPTKLTLSIADQQLAKK
jgi:Short-chain dehydrogenases of various substrate specificities